MAKEAVKSNTTTEASGKDLTKYPSPDKLKESHGSWSKVFRALKSDGLSTSEIAKVTDKRYQHVRNVLITPVGKPSEPAKG